FAIARSYFSRPALSTSDTSPDAYVRRSMPMTARAATRRPLLAAVEQLKNTNAFLWLRSQSVLTGYMYSMSFSERRTRSESNLKHPTAAPIDAVAGVDFRGQ